MSVSETCQANQSNSSTRNFRNLSTRCFCWPACFESRGGSRWHVQCRPLATRLDLHKGSWGTCRVSQTLHHLQSSLKVPTSPKSHRWKRSFQTSAKHHFRVPHQCLRGCFWKIEKGNRPCLPASLQISTWYARSRWHPTEPTCDDWFTQQPSYTNRAHCEAWRCKAQTPKLEILASAYRMEWIFLQGRCGKFNVLQGSELSICGADSPGQALHGRSLRVTSANSQIYTFWWEITCDISQLQKYCSY